MSGEVWREEAGVGFGVRCRIEEREPHTFVLVVEHAVSFYQPTMVARITCAPDYDDLAIRRLIESVPDYLRLVQRK